MTVSFVEGAIRLKKKQERGDLQVSMCAEAYENPLHS